MTNEEAIKHLKWFSEYNEDEYCGGDRIQKGADWYYYINKEDFEAFDVAIKALEQEPCEDAISLKEVIEWLKTKDIIKLSSQEKTARRELKALSSVKPQEPCEDCISRQAVLDGLTSIAKAKAKSDAQKSLMGRVMFFTEHLPSVTPKTDVLDKIRAEIKEVQTYKMFEGEDTVYVERKDVLAIIDKYNAESEGKK